MKITFTREGKRTYSTIATREDKVTVSIPAHDRPLLIPHDMAHYIVERSLQVEFGFWGKVAKGAMFAGMEVISGRRRPHSKQTSQEILKQGHQMATVAEVMVDGFMKLAFDKSDTCLTEAVRFLRSAWTPHNVKPLGLDEPHVSQILADLRAAAESWKQLPVGSSITVEWSERL